MAHGRRKALRSQAVDIANCSGVTEKKIDWEKFHRTGAFDERPPLRFDDNPLVQEQLDKIKANGGRFVAE